MNTCTMCSSTGPATCDACLRRFLDHLCEREAYLRLELTCMRGLQQREQLGDLAPREWLRRRHRKAANRAMRALGIDPPREIRVHHVHLTKTPLPPTAKEFKGLLRGTNGVWIYSRRKAQALVAADIAAGGAGVMLSYEYQRCLVCGNVLIGLEAADYRQRRRWPRYKCNWPWGPQCNASCKPNEKRAAEAIRSGLTRYERNREEWSA